MTKKPKFVMDGGAADVVCHNKGSGTQHGVQTFLKGPGIDPYRKWKGGNTPKKDSAPKAKTK